MSLSKDIVKFNSHTPARDKIFRLIQYGSRLILWQLTYGSPDVQGEVVVRLKKLEGALALSRKLFRLGNCMDLVHKTIDALSVPHLGMRFLTVTSQAMKAVWLLIDHLLWFGKVGLVKVDLPYWTKWSLRAWVIALASASLADIIILESVHNRLQQYRKGSENNTKLPHKMQMEMHSSRMNFWRDFCDLFIPLGGLGYASPGVAALCGVVSSIIGFQLEWEKHIKPFQPKS